MTQLLSRIHNAARATWLAVLSRLNVAVGFVCAGVVMLEQTRPQLVNQLIASFTPTQQALAGVLFCSLVQYALTRAKKA